MPSWKQTSRRTDERKLRELRAKELVDRRDEIMLILIAVMVPLAALPDMLGF
jgi:hypothetical protein